jgi:hypothetical protein
LDKTYEIDHSEAEERNEGSRASRCP